MRAIQTLLIFFLRIRNLVGEHPGCRTHTDIQGFEYIDCSVMQIKEITTVVRLNEKELKFMPGIIGTHMRALNLSGNEFNSLNSSSFTALRHPESLESIDLSNNKIVFVAQFAFKSLTKLKFLNLSGNNLHTINRSSFFDLISLESLILDQNSLSSFPERTFSSLISLKSISIESNQLSCDCQITDFLKFINKSTKVTVSNRTVCIFPKAFRNQQLSSMKTRFIRRTCGRGDFNPKIFNVQPSSGSLIVYPGQNAQLICSVSTYENLTVEWLKDNVPIKEDKRIHINISDEGNVRIMILSLDPVHWDDEGDWTCYAEYKESSLRSVIRLLPIAVNSGSCVQEWVANEKGEIVWPASRQGNVEMNCPHGPSNTRAHRMCKQGKWEEVDSGACAYASATTKHLIFLLSSGNISTYLKEIPNIVSPDHKLSSYETRLIGWMIGNGTVVNGRELLVVLSMVLNSDSRYEVEGDVIRNRIQKTLFVENVISERNIGMCQQLIFPEIMQHNLEYDSEYSYKSGFISVHDTHSYSCRRQIGAELLSPNGMSSVRIPYETLRLIPTPAILRVYWFRKTNIMEKFYSSDGEWIAPSEMHAIAIKRLDTRLLSIAPFQLHFNQRKLNTSAIYFTFHVALSAKKTRLGIWFNDVWKIVSEDECKHMNFGPSYVLITCQSSFLFSLLNENFTYFTLMENHSAIKSEYSTTKYSFQFPWWTYLSSGFLVTVMFFVIVMNAFCIKVTRHNFHIIINICICILLAALSFALDLDTLLGYESCRISLHFSIIAVAYWILLAFRSLHRDVNEFANRSCIQEKNLTSAQEKMAYNSMIVGEYFLAYGIALFVTLFARVTDSTQENALNLCFLPCNCDANTSDFSFILALFLSNLFAFIFYIVIRHKLCCLEKNLRCNDMRKYFVATDKDYKLDKMVDTFRRDHLRSELRSITTVNVVHIFMWLFAVPYVHKTLYTIGSFLAIVPSILFSVLTSVLAIKIFLWKVLAPLRTYCYNYTRDIFYRADTSSARISEETSGMVKIHQHSAQISNGGLKYASYNRCGMAR